jgi:gas vesicle protein
MNRIWLILGLCLLTKVVQAQATSQQASNAAPTTRTEILLSDGKAANALAKWLDQLATAKPAEKESWWAKAMPVLAGTLCGGLISAAVSLIGLRMTAKREEQRDTATTAREEQLTTLRADFEKQKVQFSNQLESDLAKLRASLEEARDAAKDRRGAELEELRASLQITPQVFKARQERLEKFHAPLRALLQQSRGVTDKLCHHVYKLSINKKWPSEVNADPCEYAFLTNEEAAAKKRQGIHPPPEDGKQRDRRLRVWHSDQWNTFRMLDYMPWLISNRDCKVLVDQVMAIGRKQTEIISTYGGLAAVGQEPSPLFGEYLAHFAVLEATYNMPPGNPYPPESQKVGYYPRGMDAAIEQGYLAARNAVAEYEALAAAILTRWSARANPASPHGETNAAASANPL